MRHTHILRDTMLSQRVAEGTALGAGRVQFINAKGGGTRNNQAALKDHIT